MRRHVATTEDIARHVGVSRATVSYVLNGKSDSRVSEATRDAVLTAAKDLKWRRNRVAEAMPNGRIYTIGVVIGDKEYIHSQYVKSLHLAITFAAQARNLRTTLVLGTTEDGIRVNDLGDGRLDGVITMGNFCTPEWVASVEDINLPCVVIGSESGRHRVMPPDIPGAREAVRFLYDSGHRRIAHIAGSDQRVAAVLRARGFVQAIGERGMDANLCPVLPCRTGQEIRDSLATLLKKGANERPTAVFAFSDHYAMYALDAIQEMGLRVPQDVSLIGYDNEITATIMRPRLTTVQNPLDAIGEAAVVLLQMLCDGDAEAEPDRLLVTPAVVVRETTAPPTL